MLQMSNSYWEIQKLETFQGGKVGWRNKIRIRHVGTGRFLAYFGSSLTLLEKSDATCDFTLMSDGLEEDEKFLTFGSYILLKTFNEQIVQVYTDFYDKQKLLNNNFIMIDHDSQTQVGIVIGHKIDLDYSKEVFEIKNVENVMFTLHAQSYFQKFFDFYSFLNDWGIGEVVEEDDDHEIKDKYFKYDLDICRTEEDVLLIETDK